jgi:hypothetical protein
MIIEPSVSNKARASQGLELHAAPDWMRLTSRDFSTAETGNYWKNPPEVNKSEQAKINGGKPPKPGSRSRGRPKDAPSRV